MFNFFKRKENKPNISEYKFHQVFVKKKKDANIYVGQFLKIEAETIEDDDIIEDVKYYFSAFKDGIVTSKIKAEHQEYCENYNYGLVKSINNDIIEVLIICVPGYIQKYKIELYKDFQNGDAFIIKDGLLYENNTNVGKIVDSRYNPDIPIILNCIDNDILNVFIKK